MPKEQSILELARTLVKEAFLRDTDPADPEAAGPDETLWR